jgi:integrase
MNLGADKDMSDISLRDWESFIEDRSTGAINARGERVDDHTKRRVVRLGTVAAELTFLQSVLNFGTRWRENGRYVLSENCCRGYPMPRERNVRRPVADEARYLAVRAVAGQVMMVSGRGKNKREEPSYLPGLLDLMWHSGRRISAGLGLRYVDLRLDEGPCGAILWPSSSDKCGKEWLAPINEDLRATINEIRADRQLKGSPFLFPHPSDSNRPATLEHATKWLLEAESLAGLEKQDGSLWHAYRRGWATLRKHLPDVDVARAGGWLTVPVMKTCYQHADDETMQEVASVSSLRRSTA